MKLLLAFVVSFVFSTLCVYAEDKGLENDLAPANEEVTLYKWWDGTVLLGSTTKPEFVATNLIPGRHYFRMSTVNATGESPKSDPAEYLALPGKPGVIRYTGILQTTTTFDLTLTPVLNQIK